MRKRYWEADFAVIVSFYRSPCGSHKHARCVRTYVWYPHRHTQGVTSLQLWKEPDPTQCSSTQINFIHFVFSHFPYTHLKHAKTGSSLESLVRESVVVSCDFMLIKLNFTHPFKFNQRSRSFASWLTWLTKKIRGNTWHIYWLKNVVQFKTCY